MAQQTMNWKVKDGYEKLGEEEKERERENNN
jgi:hypothetical protein